MSDLPVAVSEYDMNRGGGVGTHGPPNTVRHAALGPLSWYAKWVRGNPSNAHQLENLIRTVTMVLSDPSNLINMEGYWSLSKLYTFANQTILNTANRSVGASDMAAVFLHVMQEVECLVELAMRKYHGHYAAWNTMLIMQLVKCVANFGVNRHFFLTRWVWAAVRLIVRRMIFYIIHGSRLRYRRSSITDSAVRKNTCFGNPFSYFSSNGSGGRRSSSNHTSNRSSSTNNTNYCTNYRSNPTNSSMDTHHYSSGGSPSRGSPSKANSSYHDSHSRAAAAAAASRDGFVQQQQQNGHGKNSSAVSSATSSRRRPHELQLVIPRVVTRKRDVHRHYAAPLDADVVMTPMEASLARSEAETVQLTWIDVLGMAVDGYILLRPLLVVASARWAFLRDRGAHSSIGIIPTSPSLLSDAAATSSSDTGSNKSLDAVEQKDAASTAHDDKDSANRSSEAGDRLFLVRAAVQATSQRSLHSSWRLWLLFTALDVLVAVLARFIRQRRVPVVYIREDAEDLAAAAAAAEKPSASSSAATAGGVLVSPRGPAASSSTMSLRSARDGEVDGGSRVSYRSSGGVIVHSSDANDGSNEKHAGNKELDSTESNGVGGAAPAPMSPTMTATAIPAIVSRDAARQQHAMRNLLNCLLRDPFFAAVLKEWISRNLVHGWVNKIPLLGGLVSFQVAYFLSMQHFSFLYSVGQ